MVKPLLPIIEYHANYDYIANVLCENRDRPYLDCNGKCYLEKQLKKINHDNHDHKSTIPQINLDDYPVSPIENYSFRTKSLSNTNFVVFFEFNKFKQEYYTSLLKPPQAVS